jgi:hypothetical protein
MVLPLYKPNPVPIYLPNPTSVWAKAAKMPELASFKQVGGEHYKNKKIQPSYYSYVNNLGWKAKNGKEDLEKAIHILQLLLEHIDE